MKILFLAANPVDVVSRVRIDREIREISQKIRMSTHGNQLELVSEWAVRAGDLQAALLRHQPDIVHFSGHASQTGGIMLEDEAGMRKVVSRKALADLFSLLKDNIRVVVLNACYAKDQAQALTGTIDFTIGMNTAIEDGAASVFAAHFYQALAFGLSVKKAFDLAVNQLELEGIVVTQVPELLVRKGANPSKIRIVKQSRPTLESVSEAATSEERRVAMAENLMRARVIPQNNSKIIAGGLMRHRLAGEEPPEKHRTVAALPWLFASVAIILTADILRRFLGGDGGWPDIAATVVQLVFIIFATLAFILVGISLLRPVNTFAGKTAGLGMINDSAKAWRAAIFSGIALVTALGLWLSLPVFAHYFNERGARFQYREQPDLSRARESYQQAVRLNTGYAPAHYNLALVQEGLQPEAAIEEYLLAIKFDSHIYPAYNNLARLYLLRGKGNDYENALNVLRQAGDLSPQDENVQYSLNKNLGWANYVLKHYSVAETYLRKAISLRSNQGAAAHCLLAYVLKEQGKAGVVDECFSCVSLAPGEKDVEAKWVSDAQDCFMKEDRK